jgi:hypothetical protein
MEQFQLSPEDQLKADEAQEKIDKYHDKLALAYGEIFRSPAGQFALKDLTDRCNGNASCVRDAVHPDANAVLFESGKQAVLNYIMIYVRKDNARRKGTEF